MSILNFSNRIKLLTTNLLAFCTKEINWPSNTTR